MQLSAGEGTKTQRQKESERQHNRNWPLKAEGAREEMMEMMRDKACHETHATIAAIATNL